MQFTTLISGAVIAGGPFLLLWFYIRRFSTRPSERIRWAESAVITGTAMCIMGPALIITAGTNPLSNWFDARGIPFIVQLHGTLLFLSGATMLFLCFNRKQLRREGILLACTAVITVLLLPLVYLPGRFGPANPFEAFVRFAWKPRYNPPPLSFSGDSSFLKRSVIVPTLDSPIEPGRNVVWCAPFQCAWTALQKNVAHGPVQVDPPRPEVTALNAASDLTLCLPPDAAVVEADWVKNGVVQKIHKQLSRLSPKAPLPDFNSVPATGAIAYSYLQTSLPFSIPFFLNNKPLEFSDTSGTKKLIRSFGICLEHRGAYYPLREQVGILYEMERPHTFILDLCRDSRPNQIVVAAIDPGRTLNETLRNAQSLIREGSNSSPKIGANDQLLIPEMCWSIDHRFKELENITYLNPAVPAGIEIIARQAIQFRLDRHGVELVSEAEWSPRSGPRRLVLDRPFLLFMRRRDCETPFLVMWVENGELLQPWERTGV